MKFKINRAKILSYEGSRPKNVVEQDAKELVSITLYANILQSTQ